MFIGHFGLGLAAKKFDSKPSLGTMFFASQFIDLLWPVFLITGLERVLIEPGNTAFTPLNFVHYPISHSFIGVFTWAVLFGTVYYFFKKNLNSSILLALLVMSHWVLDFITHRPDLPLFWGDNVKVGLGLWNSIAFTMIIEGAIFFTGVYLYLKVTKAENKKGKYGFISLLIFLLIVYLLNVFGSPPPNEKAIGFVGLSQWLLIGWGYWIDKNRSNIK
jgi:membrane-bound metal-dependent hydrolase YbcI (DUF457 family)